MAYYLQMDGVDDSLYYSGASFTIDEVILDCSVTSGRAAFDKYQGSSSGRFLQRNGSNQDSFSGWSAVELNGVAQTNNTSFVPVDTRVTIRLTGTSVSNTQIYIFANNTAGSGAIPGKIYGVTLKNAGVVVLSWDLTLGNALDQSGNGRNGTLSGGTWVSDSTGTTHEGTSSVTGVSTLSATATVIPAAVTGSASLQGVATISATADVISPAMTGSASLTGVGSVTATASVIRAGSAVLQGVSTLTANAAGLSVLGGAFLTGVGWLMATAIEGTELVSIIRLMGKRDLDVQLYASQELTVHLYGSR